MRYAVTFLLLSAGLIALAVRTGGWGWLILSPAVSSLLLSIGYFGAGARVLGKRLCGSIAPWALLIHAPYLFITLLIWHLLRLFSRENVADQVAPGIWVGRRPLASELPAEIRHVIDLTAEFWPAAGVRRGRGYMCHPILDGHICDDAGFARAMAECAALEGAVYIHCAQGHGRSAALAAALILARGLATDVAQAEALLRAARPGVHLERVQREMVTRSFLHGPVEARSS